MPTSFAAEVVAELIYKTLCDFFRVLKHNRRVNFLFWGVLGSIAALAGSIWVFIDGCYATTMPGTLLQLVICWLLMVPAFGALAMVIYEYVNPTPKNNQQ